MRDFPAADGRLGGASNFTAEARFGLEWLLRMWNDSTRTLYYQVGIGEGNANTRRRPRHLAPAAGRRHLRRQQTRAIASSATAPCSAPARRARRSARTSPDATPPRSRSASRCSRSTLPELAARCLHAGEHIFELADTDPQGHLLTAIPFDFYPETEWRDDLELGATELAIALSRRRTRCRAGLPHTQPLYYLEQAAHWARAYIAHDGATANR